MITNSLCARHFSGAHMQITLYKLVVIVRIRLGDDATGSGILDILASLIDSTVVI